jgi:hypothetical protein
MNSTTTTKAFTSTSTSEFFLDYISIFLAVNVNWEFQFYLINNNQHLRVQK